MPQETSEGVSLQVVIAHETAKGVSYRPWLDMKRPRVFLSHKIRPRVLILALGVKDTPQPQIGTSR